MQTWESWSWEQRFLHVFLLGIAAIALYIGVLWLSGLRLHHLKAKTTALE